MKAAWVTATNARRHKGCILGNHDFSASFNRRPFAFLSQTPA
jgi:hypothetical protein